MKKLLITALLGLSTAVSYAEGKTLMIFYSFSGNIEKIAETVKAETGADLVKVEPLQEGLNYAANNYSLGSDLIDRIRRNPNDSKSYPPIEPIKIDFSSYDFVIIGTPLWWSQMAAPMQTFLYNNANELEGKKLGLIVSSASSGISGVERDAHRLIPKGDLLPRSLWIRSSQTSSAPILFSNWLKEVGYTEKK